MAKNRNSGSKKIVAILPYLTAPSDDEIDRMEIEASWQQFLPKNNEERFFDWMMEIDFSAIDQQIDDEHCLTLELRYSSRIRHIHRPSDDYFYFLYDCRDMHLEDLDSDPRDDDEEYPWGEEDHWSMLQSMQESEEDSFCPEQAIVQEIPLRGLKCHERQALLKEYCCVV